MTLFKLAQASRAFIKRHKENEVCAVTNMQLAQIKKDCHISSRQERAIVITARKCLQASPFALAWETSISSFFLKILTTKKTNGTGAL
jgi:hypothetical protein